MIAAGRIAAGLGALALVAAPIEAAHASSCGGGGSDGGSSSSSSSSSSSDSSYDYAASSSTVEPACVDTTDIHGYRTCTGYGRWSMVVPLSFELGTTSTLLDLSRVAIDGQVEHPGAAYSYRVVGDDLGARATAVGLTARVLGHGRHGYAGLETGFATVAIDAVGPVATSVGGTLAPRPAFVLTGGVVVGARTFAGRLSLGGELMAGARALGVEVESRHDSCFVAETRYDVAAAIEARARADLWLSPWLSAGAYVGRDIRTRDTSAALLLGAHFSAFDGGR